jgi:hypothetical protein
MRKNVFNTFLVTLVYLCLIQHLYSWEKTYTHPALSQEAANDSQLGTYLQSHLGYDLRLNTQLQITDTATSFVQDLIDRGMERGVTTRSILGWMQEGSKLEDARIRQARSQHHFYDPIRNSGLDNRTDHPDWEGFPTIFSPFDLRGESALFWITTGTSSTGYPKNNQETWSTTRDKFYGALTSNSPTDREQCMAETFIALGHILHMLEDMGVPAHTRNDFLFGHYRSAFMFDWGNPFETWVEKQIEQNGGISPWSGKEPVVFDKLAKYFDAEVYSGDYLGDGIVPPDTWGLSECSNYQFLSLSTIFRNDGSLYVFPHPSKENVPPNLLLQMPAGKKIYFNGSNYGVTYIARRSYTRYKAGLWGHQSTVFDNTNTTNDVFVFEDYANITIPRTIDYTAGLLNYFFRGKLEVSIKNIDSNTEELTITNKSRNSDVNQILKGGEFELYWDDSQRIRNEVPLSVVGGWGSESVLEYGGNIKVRFTPPVGAYAYTVVYKGNIIHSESGQMDENDTSAIAVGRVLFSLNDCCCFLDPNEYPDWDEDTTYAVGTTVQYYSEAAGQYFLFRYDLYGWQPWSMWITYSNDDLVTYGGLPFQSLQDNNFNRNPASSPEWWEPAVNKGYNPFEYMGPWNWWHLLSLVASCGNETWNDYPPYGGRGKSPKFYKLTLSGIQMLNWDPQHYTWDLSNVNTEHILEQNPSWPCRYAAGTTAICIYSNPPYYYEYNYTVGISLELRYGDWGESCCGEGPCPCGLIYVQFSDENGDPLEGPSFAASFEPCTLAASAVNNVFTDPDRVGSDWYIYAPDCQMYEAGTHEECEDMPAWYRQWGYGGTASWEPYD